METTMRAYRVSKRSSSFVCLVFFCSCVVVWCSDGVAGVGGAAKDRVGMARKEGAAAAVAARLSTVDAVRNMVERAVCSEIRMCPVMACLG